MPAARGEDAERDEGMHFVLFTHSLVSDWNHGNAHFQRGILRELLARGHSCQAWEPADGWSRSSLLPEQGRGPVERFEEEFPALRVGLYSRMPDLEPLLEGADVVLVHEWTDPELVAALGRKRRMGGRFTLLFHDTHHRGVSAADEIATMALEGYDAVLAFGEVLTEVYRRRGWGRRVFTWHEAADLRLFHPLPEERRQEDLVWIGNWGDGERSAELREYLIEPAAALGLSGSIHGVRYPQKALQALEATRLRYRGWLPNIEVPQQFARPRVTLHVPRRPYVTQLPGIPTIRVFEALACGIPLICAPCADAVGLFRPGYDYLVAQDGEAMKRQLRRLLSEPALAESLARSGLETIRSRHSCAHRVEELLAILKVLHQQQEAAE